MKFDFDKTIYGKVTQVLTTDEKDNFVTRKVDEIEATFDGFIGDRHSGNTRISGGREKKHYKIGTLSRNNRQWSALSEEELIIIADAMGVEKISAESVGANLIFEGIPDFTKLPALSHIYINHESEDAVCLVVFEENGPCKYPNEVIKNENESVKSTFMVAAKGLRGTVGWVDKPGTIRVGDSVKILIPINN